MENNKMVVSQKFIFYSEFDVSEKYWSYKHETSIVSKNFLWNILWYVKRCWCNYSFWVDSDMYVNSTKREGIFVSLATMVTWKHHSLMWHIRCQSCLLRKMP
jgi:hypothetical protein